MFIFVFLFKKVEEEKEEGGVCFDERDEREAAADATAEVWCVNGIAIK